MQIVQGKQLIQSENKPSWLLRIQLLSIWLLGMLFWTVVYLWKVIEELVRSESLLINNKSDLRWLIEVFFQIFPFKILVQDFGSNCAQRSWLWCRCGIIRRIIPLVNENTILTGIFNRKFQPAMHYSRCCIQVRHVLLGTKHFSRFWFFSFCYSIPSSRVEVSLYKSQFKFSRVKSSVFKRAKIPLCSLFNFLFCFSRNDCQMLNMFLNID